MEKRNAPYPLVLKRHLRELKPSVDSPASDRNPMGLWRSRLYSNYGEEVAPPRRGDEDDYGDHRSRPLPRRRRDYSDNHASYVPSRRRAYDGHRSDGGAEGDGILVYDNLVTGDPTNVVFGRGNRAGRRLGGRVSGNRVMR